MKFQDLGITVKIVERGYSETKKKERKKISFQEMWLLLLHFVLKFEGCVTVHLYHDN
jgi:hypothetical protein